ncbi:hypothetical protein J6590_087142 [Homalodisca vitripennis]|nr:hypothetical protein J6590_087142 [Homalodisca vitripennis]
MLGRFGSVGSDSSQQEKTTAVNLRCDGTVVYLRTDLCGGSRQIKLGEAAGLQLDFDNDGRYFNMLAIYCSPAMDCQLLLSELELYYSKLANNTSYIFTDDI